MRLLVILFSLFVLPISSAQEPNAKEMLAIAQDYIRTVQNGDASAQVDASQMHW